MRENPLHKTRANFGQTHPPPNGMGYCGNTSSVDLEEELINALHWPLLVQCLDVPARPVDLVAWVCEGDSSEDSLATLITLPSLRPQEIHHVAWLARRLQYTT